jgi:hypothetical protein
MEKSPLLICLTIICFSCPAQSFIATYSFAAVTSTTGLVDPSPVPQVAGISFGSFSATGTSTSSGAAGRFSFTGWPGGAINGTDTYSLFTGANSPTVYYEVCLTPQATYTVTLDSLTFGVRRSSTGIRNYALAWDLDGYTTFLPSGTGNATRISVIPTNIFFWNYDSVSITSDVKGSTVKFIPALTGFTNTITFRIYAWNSEAGGGTFSIDNFSFRGAATNVSVTPTPTLDTGIHEMARSGTEAALFPNPFYGGEIRNDNCFGCKLEIRTITGTVVQTLEPGEATQLHGIQNGVYIVSLSNGIRITARKLVVCR